MALAAALSAAAAMAAALPAAAGAAWAEPQTICAGCSESDQLVSFAEAPSGAAVAAWHGDRATLAAYRGPNDDTFSAPFTVASGGKPQFVRAAIGADGTAAVSTWIPAAAGTQVIARRTPSANAWTVVGAPDGGTNAHVAVGGDGSILVAEWIVSATTPTDQKLNAYRLPANSTAFSAPVTLYSLAAPFTSQQGIALAGNGEGQFVAAVTVSSATAAQTQALAAYSADGATWGAAEKVGAAPSTLTQVALDASGNALATYTGGAQPQSVFRSHFDDGWRTPTPVPAGAGQAIAFDLAGNAALLGTSGASDDAWGYTVRNGGNGGYGPAANLGNGGVTGLAVSPAGDTLVVRQAGTTLTSSWGSTLTAGPLGNDDTLPGSGPRSLIGVGADQNSLGTAVWASDPSSGLGSVFASTRSPGSGDAVTLSTQQLLTNQRISQAAVLRSNGALDALDAGLPALAFRTSAFGAGAFGTSVPVLGTATPAAPSNARGYLVPIPSKSGSGSGQVELTQQQLLINQRISQAAVLRSNAVRDRLNSGLTAAQVGSGVITTPNLLPGLSFGTLGAGTPGTPITVPSASGGSSGSVTLSTQQLLINQRISQAAVRRSNLNIARLQAGLTQDQIAAGGIASQNVKP